MNNQNNNNQAQDMTRSLGIIVKFYGPTNTRGARLGFKFSNQDARPVSVDYSYKIGNVADQAYVHLSGLGYQVDTIVPVGQDYLFVVNYDCARAMSDKNWPLK